MIRDILTKYLVCLSLANLIMIKVWVRLLPFSPGNSFYLAHSPYNDYLAAIINTVIISVVLLIFLRVSSRWHLIEAYAWLLIYVVTTCIVLDGIRIYINWSIRKTFALHSSSTVLLAFLISLLLFALIIFLVRKRLISFMRYNTIALLFLPFILVTFGQSGMAMRQAEPEASFLPHEHGRLHVEGTKPVVWVIFDEFDYGVAFRRRPKSLFLPELDLFKQECLNCTNALSPSHVGTEIAVPALLTGTRLKATKPLSSSAMMIINSDGTAGRLETHSTIFTDMHDRGNSTAIFGWFFPYSRIFKNVDVTQDFLYFDPTSNNISATILLQVRSLFESVSFSPFGDSLSIRKHVTTYQSMQAKVIRYLKDGRPGLVFLHYPIPHSPYIYNRHSQKIRPNKNIHEGYLDNLALVDRTLGEIRATMKHAGTWDQALVIVSSDHHWRSNTFDGILDTRVPFMVKMPYQKNTEVFGELFETVRTREMIAKFIDGTLRTPKDVANWMEKPKTDL